MTQVTTDFWREMLEDVDVATVLGRLRVRVGGTGPAMIFWPSLMMDGAMWSAQAEHFMAGHQVVVVDTPGHGSSEPLSRLFTFDECAQCVVQILDALSLETVHFVGNSWGGMIGATFAALHPDRVASAVLMNCTASPAALRQKVEYQWLLAVAQGLGGIRGPLIRASTDAFVGPTTRRDRPQVVAHIEDKLRSVNVRSAKWAVRSVVPRRPDQHALLARITAPVLVVAGAEDATFPVPETRRMADAIPGARFVVLANAAHLAALEVPDEVNTLIDDFLPR